MLTKDNPQTHFVYTLKETIATYGIIYYEEKIKTSEVTHIFIPQSKWEEKPHLSRSD